MNQFYISHKAQKELSTTLEQMIKVSWVQTAYAIAWLVWLGKNCSKLGNGKKRLLDVFSVKCCLVVPPGIIWVLWLSFYWQGDLGTPQRLKNCRKLVVMQMIYVQHANAFFFFWQKCNWFPSTSKGDLKQYFILFCRLVLPSLLDMYLAFLKNLCRYILRIPLWINMS